MASSLLNLRYLLLFFPFPLCRDFLCCGFFFSITPFLSILDCWPNSVEFEYSCCFYNLGASRIFSSKVLSVLLGAISSPSFPQLFFALLHVLVKKRKPPPRVRRSFRYFFFSPPETLPPSSVPSPCLLFSFPPSTLNFFPPKQCARFLCFCFFFFFSVC